MTQPRKRKQPASPVPPPALVPAASTITADELRASLTWQFPITPSRVITCRHCGQEDLLFEGIVPAPLQQLLAAHGGAQVHAADGLAISHEFIPVLESYAVRVALQPRIVPRAAEGEPEPAEPAGSIGVWRLPLSVLARLFAEGVNRVLEVRPISPMFPGPSDAVADRAALHGESVRPTTEPMAAPGADA